MRAFQYTKPASVADAVQAMAGGGAGMRFLAGGTASSRVCDGAAGEGGCVERCWSGAGVEQGTSRKMIPPFPSGH